MKTQGVQTFYQQIGSNRRRPLLLVLVIMRLLGVFGFVIGFAIGGTWQAGVVAIVIAVVIALLMTSVSCFAGDSIVLAASGAREVTQETAPQLMNVVRELSLAANLPVPRIHI